jgi:hypothetical protein
LKTKEPNIALVVLLALVAGFAAPLLASRTFASEYDRQCSVTGAAAQQLSSVLSTCGYSGTVSLQELTVRNPDSAANDLYVGQSDASSANGFKLAPGESMTWRAASQTDSIDAGRKYLYVSSTQNAAISLRSK